MPVFLRHEPSNLEQSQRRGLLKQEFLRSLATLGEVAKPLLLRKTHALEDAKELLPV